MITRSYPKNWKEMQKSVAEILSQCGFKVNEEFKVKGVRGFVTLDVYAEEEILDRKIKYCFECKYWNKKIPLSVVQGFRTLIYDLGFDIGYIISTKGFQKGALNAINNTNIKLITWEDFQNIFQRTWIEKYFIPVLTAKLDQLFEFTEIFLPDWFSKLSNQNKKKFFLLRNKYLDFSVLCFSMSTYANNFSEPPKLPLKDSLKDKRKITKGIPRGFLTETSYKEFLELVLKYNKKIIEEFRVLKNSIN